MLCDVFVTAIWRYCPTQSRTAENRAYWSCTRKTGSGRSTGRYRPGWISGAF